MSVERISLDANILFYTVDADAGELQERAREIVRRAARGYDCFLTLQTLCDGTAMILLLVWFYLTPPPPVAYGKPGC